MPTETADIDRIAPTRRPARRAIGYQVWTDLLFVHWRMPAQLVTPLLPQELKLDTWEGDAWVGLVPFHMSGVRPWWSPSIPGISAFHETNVRTYVHHRAQGPGVWFFSLEAAHSLAVRVARWRWRLNYFRAEMELNRQGDDLQYRSRRLWPGPPGASLEIEATIGDWIGANETTRALPAGRALPGSLEFWLMERYLLYAQAPGRPLLRGQVHHSPYPVREARLKRLEETLLASSGIKVFGAPVHVAYSPGVSVEIFPLVKAT